MRHLSEIIIHCTATRREFMLGHPTSSKVSEVKHWHVHDNGWSDIGYHYLVDRDGTVATGRPLERTGAHVKGHNTGTIGIALFGGHGSAAKDDFSEHFTVAQDKALRKLISDLKRKYPSITNVSGHNAYAAKACPGFNAAEWYRDKPPSVDVVHFKPKTVVEKPGGGFWGWLTRLFGSFR